MRWAVIRHPQVGAAIVGEDSLPVHTKRGWTQTSPLVDDQYFLDPEDYPLPDTDAPETGEPADGEQEPETAGSARNTPNRSTRTRNRTED